MSPFHPDFAATVNQAVGIASVATQIRAAGPNPLPEKRIFVANIGSQLVFLELGTAGVTAAATSGMALPVGFARVLTLNAGETHFAAIAPAVGSTLYVTMGEGD
jgi:hypothetical protein